MSHNFGTVGDQILVKKKTPSVVTVGLGWPQASREFLKCVSFSNSHFEIPMKLQQKLAHCAKSSHCLRNSKVILYETTNQNLESFLSA